MPGISVEAPSPLACSYARTPSGDRVIEVMEHFDPIDIEGEDGRSATLHRYAGCLASRTDASSARRS